MRNVHRYPTENRPVFLTIVARGRSPRFADPAVKADMVRLLQQTRDDLPAKLYAWVLLDDHLHLLLHAEQDAYARFVSRWKLRCIRSIPAFDHRSPFQPRFYDHQIRDTADWRAHLDYIHYNPVKHGDVDRPADHVWSSLSALVRRGVYGADWGARDMPPSIRGDTGRE